MLSGRFHDRCLIWTVAMVLVGGSWVLGDYYRKPLPGLSIDDSYIFLQYAHNLAERGEMSFNEGEPSLGITSLAWTVLLAAMHRVRGGDLVTEAQVLGALLLGVCALCWTATIRRLGGSVTLSAFVGLALITDPYLLSHAISGMESALNLAILSALVWKISRPTSSMGVGTGILVGLAFLARPDNLVVLPALLIARAMSSSNPPVGYADNRGAKYAKLLLGSSFVLLPMSLWSYFRSGSVIPPTRIGKLLVFLPVHYQITLGQFSSMDIWDRIWVAMRCVVKRIVPMFTTECERTVAPAVILGLCALTYLSLRAREHQFVCATMWVYSLGLVASYAYFFPIVKDRHLCNVHSLAIAGVGMMGLYLEPRWRAGGGAEKRAWVARAFLGVQFIPIGVLLMSMLLSMLYVQHYRAAYLERVANINVWCLTGHYVDSLTERDAKIALEPMGAVKYCSQRYVLDMGGLVTQETWKSIAEGRGTGYGAIDSLLRAKEVGYVIDHHPSEWLGRLADRYPGSYELLMRVEAPDRERAYGATDSFDIFRTRWAPRKGPETAKMRIGAGMVRGGDLGKGLSRGSVRKPCRCPLGGAGGLTRQVHAPWHRDCRR